MLLGAIAAYFGEGSGPVFGGIYCRGTESNLEQCSPGRVGQHDCHQAGMLESFVKVELG